MTSSNQDDMYNTDTHVKSKSKFKLLKLYDYNVYDGFSIINNNENFNMYKDNKNFIIQIFGINTNGQSVCIFVEDFMPFFYIKVDDTWTDTTRNEFVAHMKKKNRKLL